MHRHHLQILASERETRERVGRRGQRGARRERKWRMGGDRTEWIGEMHPDIQRKRDVRGGRCWWRYEGEIGGALVLQGWRRMGGKDVLVEAMSGSGERRSIFVPIQYKLP
jgi:hypothetical protein